MNLSLLSVVILLVLGDQSCAQKDIDVIQQKINENDSNYKETINQNIKPLDDVVHLKLPKLFQVNKHLLNTDRNKTQESNGILSLIFNHLKNNSHNNHPANGTENLRNKRTAHGKCKGGCGRPKPKCSWCGGGGQTIGYIPIQIQKPVYIPQHRPNKGCNRCQAQKPRYVPQQQPYNTCNTCHGGGGGYPSGGGYNYGGGNPQYSYSQSSASAYSSSGSYGGR